MPELPPGPWLAIRTVSPDQSGSVYRFEDADGNRILKIDREIGNCIVVSDEVARAIEVLPILLAAARKAADPQFDDDDNHWFATIDLRTALALIDRKGD